MSENKAIFYLTEEWKEDKTKEELVKVLEVVFTQGNISLEVQSLTDNDVVTNLYNIITSKLFAQCLHEYLKQVISKLSEKPTNIIALRQIHTIAYLPLKHIMNSPRDVLQAFMKLWIDLIPYQDTYLMFVCKNMLKSKEKMKPADILKLLGLMMIKPQMNQAMIMSIYDKLPLVEEEIVEEK